MTEQPPGSNDGPRRIRRVALLANARAGRHHASAAGIALTDLLRREGVQVDDLTSIDLSQAHTRARDVIRGHETDALIVIGGDGTAHWGANACAQTDVPLLVVPAGTGNDNARTLGLPRVRRTDDLRAYADLVLSGQVSRMDLGRARSADGSSRWWLGVLGAGFDTIVNARGRTMTHVHGTARYLAAVARELPGFRGISYRLELDGVSREVDAMLVLAANGGTFGGGMRVCPDADVTDGLLDVMILHKIGRGAFLRVFPKVFTGTHVGHPAVEIIRVRAARIEADHLICEADGEEVAPLPIDVEVVPGALTVLGR